jgi:AcrR family transcriptional regulator
MRSKTATKSTARSGRSQRDLRREQLLSVALQMALESPSREISMTELARRAGLSRTSVYDYFASSSDVISQILIQELDNYAKLLSSAVADADSAQGRIRAWIEASLRYITDGDHLLAKGMGAISANPETVRIFRAKHQLLLAPLTAVFDELGIKEVHRALSFTQSVTDGAVKNIERITLTEGSSDDVQREIDLAVDLVLAAIPVFRAF